MRGVLAGILIGLDRADEAEDRQERQRQRIQQQRRQQPQQRQRAQHFASHHQAAARMAVGPQAEGDGHQQEGQRLCRGQRADLTRPGTERQHGDDRHRGQAQLLR